MLYVWSTFIIDFFEILFAKNNNFSHMPLFSDKIDVWNSYSHIQYHLKVKKIIMCAYKP